MASLTLSSTLTGGAFHVCPPEINPQRVQEKEQQQQQVSVPVGRGLRSQLEASNQERRALSLGATVSESPSRSDRDGLEELVQDGFVVGRDRDRIPCDLLEACPGRGGGGVWCSWGVKQGGIEGRLVRGLGCSPWEPWGGPGG